MARWFGAHYNEEVRFSSAVKHKKGAQVLPSLLNQKRYYYYFCSLFKGLPFLIIYYHNYYVFQGVASNAETEELRSRTLQSGYEVAELYRELLQVVLQIHSKPGQLDSKTKLSVISRKIAQSTTELVTCAQLLKGM